MTYPEALAYLSSLQNRGWRLGLDRMEELVRRAGLEESLAVGRRPLTEFGPGGSRLSANGSRSLPRFLHVAGTNGKGSVTEYLRSMLVEAGYRTGAYFSPYVYDIRERIQLGRDLICEEDFARIAGRLAPIAESLNETEFGGLTEFEFKTAMGFEYWREKKAEWVVLEVGLGGRLDATNVVAPACSVIVSIGLDHTQHLGHTLPEIAREKAGIIKPGVPVIVGDVPQEAWESILGVADDNGSPIWRFESEVLLTDEEGGGWAIRTPRRSVCGLRPGIFGPNQPHNMALAVAALDAAEIEIGDDAIRAGVARATLPGRFERRTHEGATIIFDGAHNADAARALATAFEKAFPNRKAILLTGMVSGHDAEEFYRTLLAYVERAHVAPIDFYRALPPEEIAGVLRNIGLGAKAHGSAEEALDSAIEEARKGGCPILVTGSFYLVGDVGNLLRERERTAASTL